MAAKRSARSLVAKVEKRYRLPKVSLSPPERIIQGTSLELTRCFRVGYPTLNVTDFDRDIREQIFANLPAKVADELASKDTRSLLIIFRNWTTRFVAASPRLVHISKSLAAQRSSIAPQLVSALTAIICKLQSGEDITPHLSDRVLDIHQTEGKRLSKRRDLDLMLNDWGVHHLHLSTQPGQGGFLKRTKELLFAVFRPNDAYLIGIFKHGDWTREEVIKRMVREWPAAALALELKGVIGIYGPYPTEGERKKLRDAAINSTFEVDGCFFVPAGGLASDGTGLRTGLEVGRMFTTIETFCHEINTDPGYLNRKLAEHGINPPSTADPHFEFFPNGGYGVVERTTGIRLRLSW